jgi:hypothetical protein
MRRGLIARSPVELPDAVLQARLDRVRAAMATAQLDALVIYTNNTRTAGVSWLTGFVPYWSEALLVVPRQGSPVLVAALSFRVKAWIERTSRIGEVLHAPRVGLKAGQQIAATRSDAVVGIVDFDGLAAGVADDLREGGPKLRLGDASGLYAKLRAKADPADIALAGKAASIAHRALDVAPGNDLNAIVADVESAARKLGAEEIYVAVAPDLERDARFLRIEGTAVPGRTYALRATVTYKGTWVRLVRPVCEPALVRAATARLAEAVALLPSDHGFSGFRSWLIEGCRTAQPLEALSGSRIGGSPAALPETLLHGALVSVQGAVPIDGRLVPVGAPALIGESGEAASLIVDPQFD